MHIHKIDRLLKILVMHNFIRSERTIDVSLTLRKTWQKAEGYCRNYKDVYYGDNEMI